MYYTAVRWQVSQQRMFTWTKTFRKTHEICQQHSENSKSLNIVETPSKLAAIVMSCWTKYYSKRSLLLRGLRESETGRSHSIETLISGHKHHRELLITLGPKNELQACSGWKHKEHVWLVSSQTFRLFSTVWTLPSVWILQPDSSQTIQNVLITTSTLPKYFSI